jgi:hypothetical protein
VPSINYSDNSNEYVKQLRIAGIAIQQAGAETVNIAAENITKEYKRLLKKNVRMRNEKFTLGSVRTWKAKANSGKSLRPLRDVNAIVGVMSLRDAEHYLARMEEGGVKKGDKRTIGKASIPMDTARGGERGKAILSRYRLDKHEPIDIRDKLRAAINPRQQYAMMYSMAKRGQLSAGVYQSDDAIYSVTPKKVVMLRRADKDTVEIKAQPLFTRAVVGITREKMDAIFVYAARKMLRNLEMGV